MNKDFSVQCLRSSKVYDTKQEAIDALNSVQSSDGSIVLARYKDSTGKIKTLIAPNCNLDGISDPDLKAANYTIYDPDPYTLPTASSDTLGGIKIGEGLSIDDSGIVSASGTSIEDIAWDNASNMNNYKDEGIYAIHGIRSNSGDNMPIRNYNANGYISGTLIINKTTADPETGEYIIGQTLILVNKVGEETRQYMRSCIVKSGAETWTAWKELNTIQMFGEKSSGMATDADIDAAIDNGQYMGVYTGNSLMPTGSTFVLITINNYAANTSITGNPDWRRITQIFFYTPIYTDSGIPQLSKAIKREGLGNTSISWLPIEDFGSGGVGKIDPDSDGTGEIFNSYEGFSANKATGYCSHAEGAYTTASGDSSHSEGYTTTASGIHSHAEGSYTTASGDYSHAEGAYTTASGDYSHTEGSGTTASGQSSHAEGSSTTAQNAYEHAQGKYNKSNTGTSDSQKTIHSIGIGTSLKARKNAVEVMTNGDVYINGIGGYDGTNYSSAKTLQESIPEPYTLPTASSTTLGGIKIGNGITIDGSGVATSVGKVDPNSDGTGEIFNDYENNKAVGDYSHAEGYSTTASGRSSHAEGYITTASGDTSHAEGIGTKASHEFSHAEGRKTTASGYCSHAEGELTTASGYESHAEGEGTTASGYYSHAEGRETTASGSYSHSEGYYTTAQNAYEHAQGHYNKSNTGTSDAQKTIHSIGIGTSSSAQKNAVEVMANGDVYVTGVGGYDGTNYSSAKTLQESIPEPYTLPKASSTTLGGVKIGHGITIDSSGVATAVGMVDANSDGTGEIFNDYENNKATGKYSHVEGYGKCIMNFDINAFLINLLTYGYVITVNSVSEDKKTIGGTIASAGEGEVNIALNTDMVILMDLGVSTINSLFNYQINQVIECDNSSKIVFKEPLNGITDSSTFIIIDKAKYDEESSFNESSLNFDVGDSSHSEGQCTVAIGTASHAEGGLPYVYSYNVAITSVEDTIINGDFSEIKNAGIISAPCSLIITSNIGVSVVYATKLETDHIEIDKNIGTFEKLGNSITITYNTVTSSGYASHAEGTGTTASGDYSHAEGNGTTASGISSHAEGSSTTASGDYSHAEGELTTASGRSSHAEGYITTASGDSSHSEGYTTTASGDSSHSEGYTTTASGIHSHAEGSYTTASGHYSHAEGDQTTASGNDSHAEGSSTTASGHYSHAEGSSTTAQNNSEHAQGKYNRSNTGTSDNQKTIHSIGIGTSESARKNAVEVMANGDVYVTGVGGYDGTNYSSAKTLQESIPDPYTLPTASSTTLGGIKIGEGLSIDDSGVATAVGKMGTNHGEIFNNYTSNKATGNYSHAEGTLTTASGDFSHAEGCNTTVSGSYGSHVEGYRTTASGNSSHAEGFYTTVQNESEHAQGKYNKSNTGSSNSEKTIHSIGIGLSDSDRENAVEVMANGDVYINGIGGYDGTNYASAKTLQEVTSGGAGKVDPNSSGTGEIFNDYENNKATGKYSHAEGDYTAASGFGSHAEGDYTTASGRYSHAEGSSTTASGDYSHAEGDQTTASGNDSHAEGSSTTASGHYSHAEGFMAEVNGYVSHVEGYYTTAAAYCQHVQGCFNTTVSYEPATSYSATTRAFIIGNGSSHDKKGDAFYVLFNGETHADGAFTNDGADYAEMFEWTDGNTNKEDRVGYFVTLDNDKIRLANQNDNYILGIVSGSPMVIGNNPMRWQGKYLDDEWGRPVYENIEYDEQVPMNPDDEGYDPESKEPQMKTVKRQAYVRKQNPEWNGTQEYSLRTNRDEWACVGLMGQLLVRQDGTLKAGGFCKVSDSGVATNSDTGYYVMKVNSDSQALVMFK